MFLSDHGEMAGDHGRLHKVVFYESSVRIPLIVSWPGTSAAGAVADGLVESIDRRADAAGSRRRRHGGRRPGPLLWPLLRDPAARGREDALSEVRLRAAEGEDTLMLRTSRHKYAPARRGGLPAPRPGGGPLEQVNLIGHPDRRSLEAALRDRLLRRLLHDHAVR